jgi:hypothetical protein
MVIYVFILYKKNRFDGGFFDGIIFIWAFLVIVYYGVGGAVL